MKKEPTPKQREFAKNFLNPKSDTFSNGVRSVIKAGYSDNYGAACQRQNRLRKGKYMEELNREIQEEYKLDIVHYLKDLDKMLKEGGKAPKPSREWLTGLRLALEREKEINSHQTNVAVINAENGIFTDAQIKELGKRASVIEAQTN